MQLLKKFDMIDYICMYNVYKRFIYNYNITNWFFDVVIYLLMHRISRE